MSLIRHCVAIGTALVLAAALGACGQDAETDPAGLERTWLLIQFQEGNASDPLVESTMKLSGGRLSGNGGVNDLSGSYEATGEGKLTFKTKMGDTKKAGPQEAVNQETRLMQSLDKVASFEIDDADDKHNNTELELKNSSGQTVMVFIEGS